MQNDCHVHGEWEADLVKRVVAGLPLNLDRDRFNANDMFLSQVMSMSRA